MIEVERKFALSKDNKDEIIAKLNSMFGLVAAVHQVDKVFLINSDSFRNFKSGDPIIRVRVVNDKISLTYKRSLGIEGNMIEYDLGIDSVVNAEAILQELGFKLATYIEKDRQEYKMEGAVICLDSVNRLGNFLEVEIMCNTESEILLAEEKIIKIASEFGLSKQDIEDKKYDVLMSEKGNSF